LIVFTATKAIVDRPLFNTIASGGGIDRALAAMGSNAMQD
jgi:hypothetical protein